MLISHKTGIISVSSSGGRSHHCNSSSRVIVSSSKRFLMGRAGVAADHRIGRYIFGYDRAGGYDRAVSDLYAGHHRAASAQPNIMADNCIAFMRKFFYVRCRYLPSGTAHHVERVGGRAAQPMVSRAHNEHGAVRDLAEFSDDQFLSEKRVIEENVCLFKLLGGGLRCRNRYSLRRKCSAR